MTTVKQHSDDKVRERISTELDTCFFVEAGAGSGKTKSLVDRMVSLISTGKAEIENIAAVTFTRKAAAELRERFQTELERLIVSREKPVADKEAERIRKALDNLERVFTGTIHSFCSKLLRERPIEAGIDPGFDEVEEDENTVRAEKYWEEFVAQESAKNNEIFDLLEKNGINVKSLKDTYLKIVNYPDVTKIKKSYPEPDFSSAKQVFKQTVEDIDNDCREVQKKVPQEDLPKRIKYSNYLISRGYLKENKKFITLLKLWDKDIKVPKGRKKEEKALTEPLIEKVTNFQETFISANLNQWYIFLHKPLMDFIEKAADGYALWRKQHSILNFQDLLMKTSELLKENLEVRKYFAQRLSYIFIDEFQDTDPIQAEIMLFLSDNEYKTKDWRDVKFRKGSLFIVGDPKQSIYRFRRADIDIYNQVKDIFIKNGGDVVKLTANYRSLAHIGGITDSVFKTHFPEKGDKYQAAFAELQTVHERKRICKRNLFK